MMTEREIVEKLVATYPNSIELLVVNNCSSPAVDFVGTVDNFAERIIKDFDKNRQKYYFGVMFENQQDCAKYLATYLHDLLEVCQDFVDENYYVSDGEIYYDGDDEEQE